CRVAPPATVQWARRGGGQGISACYFFSHRFFSIQSRSSFGSLLSGIFTAVPSSFVSFTLPETTPPYCAKTCSPFGFVQFLHLAASIAFFSASIVLSRSASALCWAACFAAAASA